MNGTLELGVLDGSLLRAPGFSGVVVRDPTGTAVVRLDAVRLHYAPLSLLRGSLVIHEMEVVRPHVTLSQARDGDAEPRPPCPPLAATCRSPDWPQRGR